MQNMAGILYLYIFLIGITFGSFFTLAVYRIPLGKDITHTRSFCPNCNHKLGFLDMIPLLSYLAIGGKCRYCKQKIRPRYFILELLSGIVFVLFAVSIKIYTLEIHKLVYFIFGLLYIAGLFIICGIDKERIQIQNEVVLYMSIIEVLYIIYLYVIEKTSIYRYVIYLLVLAILLFLNIMYYRKNIKNNYTIEVLILINIMLMFTYETCTIFTIITTLIIIAFKLIFEKVTKKSKYVVKDEKKKIPIGFYLGVSNIIMLIYTNFLIFYVVKWYLNGGKEWIK